MALSGARKGEAMSTVRVFEVCAKCQGRGLELEARVDVDGNRFPFEECLTCQGTGRGRLREIREEEASPRQEDPQVIELLRGQKDALQKIEKWLSPPPTVLPEGRSFVPVLPDWAEQNYAIMRDDNTFLAEAPDAWTSNVLEALRFREITQAVGAAQYAAKAGNVAAVVMLPGTRVGVRSSAP